MMRVNHYSADNAERAAKWRKDPHWIAQRLADPTSRFVVVWRSQNLVSDDLEGPRAFMAAPQDIPHLLAMEDMPPILLGLHEDRAIFAIDVKGDTAPQFQGDDGNPPIFADLRQIGPRLSGYEAAVLAHARGMVYWHERHLFCGVCGAATMVKEAGHVRVCTNPACGVSHFPRTDPAVIMLVTRGDYCLLGRQAAWPKGRYSTLAGFVEPGESLEDAVRREVMEEVGVRAVNVTYHSSQPWPFPASIMLGFTATTEDTEIMPDLEEIEHAAWFSREELRGEHGDILLPPRSAIARCMIEDWIASRGR